MTNIGDKVGRLYVQQADLQTLEIRKYQRFVEKGKRQIQKDKLAKRAADEENGEQTETEGEKPKKRVKGE